MNNLSLTRRTMEEGTSERRMVGPLFPIPLQRCQEGADIKNKTLAIVAALTVCAPGNMATGQPSLSQCVCLWMNVFFYCFYYTAILNSLAFVGRDISCKTLNSSTSVQVKHLSHSACSARKFLDCISIIDLLPNYVKFT